MSSDDFFNEIKDDMLLPIEESAEEEFEQSLMELMEITNRLDSDDEKRGFHFFLDEDEAAYIHNLVRREKYVTV